MAIFFGSEIHVSPAGWLLSTAEYMRKNWSVMSMMKMVSTTRFKRKSGSSHLSSGGSTKPTSKGVKMAVKMSAIEVTASQWPIALLERGSMMYQPIFSFPGALARVASYARTCRATSAIRGLL